MGVSAPAPPLSFLRAERGAFSAAPLSGDRLPGYCCGVLAVNVMIVSAFLRIVKRRPRRGELRRAFHHFGVF